MRTYAPQSRSDWRDSSRLGRSKPFVGLGSSYSSWVKPEETSDSKAQQKIAIPAPKRWGTITGNVARTLAARRAGAKLGSVIQPKLTLGDPGDRYEQEADRIAKHVVGQIHRADSSLHPLRESETPQSLKVPEPPEDKRVTTTTRPLRPRQQLYSIKPVPQISKLTAVPPTRVDPAGLASGEVSPGFEAEIAQERQRGHALFTPLRTQMEQAMGTHFHQVRIHANSRSDRLARSIQAKAFTTGRDIFFQQNAYNPRSQAGQKLLAHELTHVVQQRGASIQRTLAPELEAQIRSIDLEEDEETIQPKLIQAKLDWPLQRSIDTSNRHNQSHPGIIQCTKEYKLATADAAKKGQKDITAVSQNKVFKWKESEQKQLVKAVELARQGTATALTAIGNIVQGLNDEKQQDNMFNVEGYFPFLNQLQDDGKTQTTLQQQKQDAAKARTALQRVRDGLAQPVKLVQNESNVDKNTYGYVYRHKIDRQYVDLPFLDNRIRDSDIYIQFGKFLGHADSKLAASTIFHEASHKFANTHDHALDGYGDKAIQKIGRKNAMKNADSYTYFVAESAKWLNDIAIYKRSR